MTRRQVLLESISALLIMLFLYASLSKFLDFRRFVGEMNNQPFPNSFTPYLVYGIPSLEIIISITLMFERTRLLGFISSLILMMAFTIYSGTVLLHFFKYVPCSCGGVISKLNWRQHIVFNIFFVGLSLTGIILQRRKKSFKSTYITKNSFV